MGGGISLPGLTNIESGWVRVLASGIGSSVQFPMLGNFVDGERRSSLVATNGGTFELGSVALVTSGVLVNILPGTPGLPTARMRADQLVVHGRAWHSYRVDRYGFSTPPAGLELYARVPLQSDFQSIGSAVGPGLGFVAEEFVMDPGGLELTPLPAIGVGKVVYGTPGRTYELLAAGTVDTAWPWQKVATVILTNSFSILPDEPLSIPQRYFKLHAPLVP